MLKFYRNIFFFLLPVMILSCKEKQADKTLSQDSSTDRPIHIAASIIPQYYFIERITGDKAEIFTIVPPGASPATYEPSPSDMEIIAEADIYFSIGVPFEEAWLQRFASANPDLSIISTYQNINRLPINRHTQELFSGQEAQGGEISQPAGSHEYGTPDPHIWLSPELVKSQAEIICETLIEIHPSGEENYRRNLEIFLDDIRNLQEELHAILDPFSGSIFMVFHPSWGYFADEFRLIQLPIETEGSEPSPSELAALIDIGVDNRIRFIIVSPQFSTRTAEVLASQISAEIVVVDPLAENWLMNMKFITEILGEKLGDNN